MGTECPKPGVSLSDSRTVPKRRVKAFMTPTKDSAGMAPGVSAKPPTSVIGDFPFRSPWGAASQEKHASEERREILSHTIPVAPTIRFSAETSAHAAA
jgi:hypothetical protein